MAKYEPDKVTITSVKTRIPSLDPTVIDKKMQGMLWKKIDTKSEFIPGSFDETVFNGPNEFDPPYTTEKNQILSDMFISFDTTYKFMVGKIANTITEFAKNNVPAIAKYVRLSGEWIDLIISYEQAGVPPDKPLLHQALNVRLIGSNSDLPAVSDTKDFKIYEEVEDVEVSTTLRALSEP